MIPNVPNTIHTRIQRLYAATHTSKPATSAEATAFLPANTKVLFSSPPTTSQAD